jgi:hypothetical protein
MKTWMFVAAIFWLFFDMCVCPQTPEQTDSSEDPKGVPTTDVDSWGPWWNAPDSIRPPPSLN